MSIEFFIGIGGLVILPFIAWLLSSDKDKVMWKTVIVGLLIQLTLGGLVMLTQPGQQFFRFMNDVIVGLLSYSNKGAAFLFGRLVDSNLTILEDSQFSRGATFAFSVLPTIIFFSSFMGIMYFTGLMQKIVEFIAWIMMKLLGTSGAETLSVSSNIFVGQTEAPLVIRPFVKAMTNSELATVMTGGFATVAGGVMAAYVGMLKDIFPAIAGHLITASVMSAPAAIVMSKLVYPEKEKPKTLGEVKLDVEAQGENIIDAAAKGAKTGLTLALNVGAMLLAFIALVKLGNFSINWISMQIYTLVTETTGLTALLPGAVIGGILGIFFIGRWGWQKKLSRRWIAVLLLVFMLPFACYKLFPEVFAYFQTPLFFSQLGLWGGLAVGLICSFLLCSDNTSLLFNSLLAMLITIGVFGLLTYSIGGSKSSPVIAAFIAAIVLILAFSYKFWLNPDLDSLGRIILFAMIGGLVAAGLISATGVDFLEVLKDLTLEKIIGYIFSLLAFVMGVPWEDLVNFGQIIGTKMAINEFVAFLNFKAAISQLSPRSVVMLSYALCGFANFSSIAIQIGGIGGIAPSREEDLAQLGFKTMLAGTLASYQTATVAGVMFGFAQLMGINLVTLG